MDSQQHLKHQPIRWNLNPEQIFSKSYVGVAYASST